MPNTFKDNPDYKVPETFTIFDVVEALDALIDLLTALEAIPILFVGNYDPNSKIFNKNVNYMMI